jgi:hypothetical protein
MRPPEVTVADHWSLGEDGYARAAAAWRALSKGPQVQQGDWSARADQVLAAWSGQTATTYAGHRTAIEGGLGGCARLARRVADALQACADAADSARNELSAQFAAVRAAFGARAAGGGSVRMSLRAPADAAGVQAAVAQALRLRGVLSKTLAEQERIIAATVPEWEAVARSWRAAAAGAPTFAAPTEGAGTQVIRAGDTVVISTGSGDDQVSVRVDAATGEQIVTANGGQWRFPADAALVVRTGEGDDTVTVAPGTSVRLTLVGGDGADQLHGGNGADVLVGLAGNDYVSGGSGDDRISGGTGDDTVYGLSGADQISGGEGRDFLDGGAGRDDITGDEGADVVSGGSGDDHLFGGDGADVLYTGRGVDTVDGGGGGDIAYHGKGASLTGVERAVTVELADLPAQIRVEGSAEFTERVRADLELLAASPTGQQMLAALDAGLTGRDTLTIREWAEQNAQASRDVSTDRGNQRAIDYNPGYNTFLGDTPPVVVLYHEMAHEYDFVNGTVLPGRHEDLTDPDRVQVGNVSIGVPKAERQAVGLPVDHDLDPGTPLRIDPRHPLVYTENGLRSELTWRLRTRYSE